MHTVGKGKVYAGQNAEACFQGVERGAGLRLHASPQSDHAYCCSFTANSPMAISTSSTTATIATRPSMPRFRVTGKAPELWHAETGKSQPASYTIADGRTTVPLHLEPWGTVFVVFRKPTSETSHRLRAEVDRDASSPPSTARGRSASRPDRGAPASITLDKLTSWSDNSDAGVKYFSGTGTYTKTIQAPADWFKPGRASSGSIWAT